MWPNRERCCAFVVEMRRGGSLNYCSSAFEMN